MKKLRRYWWVLVIGLVVIPPVAVISTIPIRGKWKTRCYWLKPSIRQFSKGQGWYYGTEARWLHLGLFGISSYGGEQWPGEYEEEESKL